MSDLKIARRRIRNSRLRGDPFAVPEEAVGWHLAMQAQEYGPATWSIGQRSTGIDHADVDRALSDGAIVRTHVLRPTWHFVARDDLRWLLALSGPRVQQGNAGRYRQLGLDTRTLSRAEKAIASALEGGNRLTRDEIAAVFDRRKLVRDGQRMPYLLMHCELVALIGSGGRTGKQQTYALLDERIPPGRRLDRDEALVELVRRYLTSHGPATVRDMSWWSGLTMTDIRNALEMLGDEVGNEEVDGLSLWSVTSEGGRRPPPARGAHLLQTYDELVVGYTESRFHGESVGELAREAWSDRTFPSGLVLLRGRVAGHWRRTFEPKRIEATIHLYHAVTDAGEKTLEAEAKRLGRFFGLPVTLDVSRFLRR
ncbi:MAG: winged helix DNA-binding domain-containing protein [Actinomycetota bacterium]